LAAGAQTGIQLSAALPDVATNPLARQGLTIMRILGTLRINSTDANLSAEGSFGFIMMDGDAFSGGTLPDPLLDPDAPWMYWDRRVFLPPSDSQQHLRIDIRARRAWRGNDMELVLILENDDSTQTLEFAFGFRILVALP